MHLHHSAHEHDHAGSHLQPDVRLNWSFALAVVLNVLLVAGEALAGFVSGSMALLADAGHNLSDVAGLLLAWCAHWLRGKGAGEKWTYGLRAFTMVAANLNGVLIVVAIVGVSIESVRRLFDPSEVAELPVVCRNSNEIRLPGQPGPAFFHLLDSGHAVPAAVDRQHRYRQLADVPAGIGCPQHQPAETV